jgi:hypothetical protein
VELSQEFLIETFYVHCKRAVHKRYQNIFNAECPVCKEGKSAGRTRRLFYFPNKQYFFCHNCSKSWKPFEWVKEITGLSVPEIIRKNNEKVGSEIIIPKKHAKNINNDKVVLREIAELPENCIDIENLEQVAFFGSNQIIDKAIKYCVERRLFSAVNRCKSFFVSLEDKIHKNRLVIPFYGDNNKVVCYQTRALIDNQHPKYLTKFGEKHVFNITNVDPSIPYVFIFEGPIDSMFVKNGVAIAALSPTESQLDELNRLIGYEKIYVFDNDKNNKQTSKKIEKTIKDGKKVFIWPKEFHKFKDINEVCCKLQINEVSWKFIVNNSLKGSSALIKKKLLAAVA